MASTDKPSQPTNEASEETNETNQTTDQTNPELNQEFDGQPQENLEDELHGDLNQLRILSDGFRNIREPS